MTARKIAGYNIDIFLNSTYLVKLKTFDLFPRNTIFRLQRERHSIFETVGYRRRLKCGLVKRKLIT